MFIHVCQHIHVFVKMCAYLFMNPLLFHPPVFLSSPEKNPPSSAFLSSPAFLPAFLQHYFSLFSCFSRSRSIQIMMIHHICNARKHVHMYTHTFWHAYIQICVHALNHFCVCSVCMQMHICMLCLGLECVGHVCV